MADDCIFCRIGRGEIDTPLLFQDDRVFVVRDIRPKAPKHLLIIPKEHLTSLADMDLGKEAILGHLLIVAREMAKQEGVTRSGYRLVINQGPDSGQELAHLHLHLLAGRRLGAMG
ncbi:MAG: HIT domain-containing protein [Chloroflexi bacterium]|nr:HIT domain-containing protein [Chloroflexota bacterium]